MIESPVRARPDALDVVAVIPPGRFPTVVHDPGNWWAIAASEGHEPRRWSANSAWWRHLCSQAGADVVAAHSRGLGFGGRLRLRRAARAAARGLEALTRPETFGREASYLAAVASLARYIRMLNAAASGISFGLDGGVEVDDLAYDSSAALVAAAEGDGPIADLIGGILDEAPFARGRDRAVLLMNVTLPEDLFLGLALISGLRRAGSEFHACLIDHGHENFTLRPHLARLRGAGTLDRIFDTIVEAKDERDRLVPAVLRALGAGAEPRGYLTSASPVLAPFLGPASELVPRSSAGAITRPPPVPTFMPEPVLVTRLSSRRCYWARCAFCIHNVKYDDRRVISTADVPAAVDGLETWLDAGYRIVTLNDEALAPPILAAVCDELERRQVHRRHPDFRWTCRSKLELGFGAELFRRLRAAGCVEILFGLESASERVRGLMDKTVAGLDTTRLLEIIRAAGAAGIGVHLNLIAGFPGETLEELTESLRFLVAALHDARFATYVVNEFVVFPATPVAEDPERFGIEIAQGTGDMPALIPHRPLDRWAREARWIRAKLPELRADLDQDLGWAGMTGSSDLAVARHLVFATGHGALFKAEGMELPGRRPGSSIAA
jgi:hypothetical protein